jgi:hypothetical protein
MGRLGSGLRGFRTNTGISAERGGDVHTPWQLKGLTDDRRDGKF